MMMNENVKDEGSYQDAGSAIFSASPLEFAASNGSMAVDSNDGQQATTIVGSRNRNSFGTNVDVGDYRQQLR